MPPATSPTGAKKSSKPESNASTFRAMLYRLSRFHVPPGMRAVWSTSQLGTVPFQCAAQSFVEVNAWLVAQLGTGPRDIRLGVSHIAWPGRSMYGPQSRAQKLVESSHQLQILVRAPLPML